MLFLHLIRLDVHSSAQSIASAQVLCYVVLARDGRGSPRIPGVTPRRRQLIVKASETAAGHIHMGSSSSCAAFLVSHR